MTYSPKAIANYFLDLAKQRGEAISPMKLQKLVYYAHGWFAGNTGKPLIDEEVEAWQYGPVIPSLYHEFKRFGSGPISQKATDFVGLRLQEVATPAEAGIRQFLDSIWRTYGHFTAVKLSDMTHAPDGPWDRTRRGSEAVRNTDIPFEVIRAHFLEAVQKARSKKEAS